MLIQFSQPRVIECLNEAALVKNQGRQFLIEGMFFDHKRLIL